ncbi:DUF2637 domain-containing protein [Frigoribacterium sp. SL97]|uniref:DUF2637 domain-containing protein n=1 Tax=Frigoribacterium sp. SL97 TaxID=2994664 RepID=UPI002270C384|nr:DUF2637 domain-containing protein [Frigoribacterium sp. SL97]WAC50493.1 DUF2637 domain-containing protein [Frigoribacterium sp. SL97]
MTPTPEGATSVAPTTAVPPHLTEASGVDALRRVLRWPVIVTVAVIIAVAFLLSFQAQTDLAVAANMDPSVAWGLPVVIDGTILTGTFATMLLVHHRRRKARAIATGSAIPTAPIEPRSSWYPWAVLLSFGALSIWINSLHATARTPETWELQLIGAVPPLGLLLSTHLLVLILHKASQTTGSLPMPVTVPLLEEQPSAEAEGVSVDEPAEVPVTEAVAVAAPAPAVEPVAVPSPVDVPVAPPAAPPVAQVAAALERAPEAPSAPDVPAASAPAPAAPAAVTPAAAPPRARTAPAAKRAPALTRDEAYGRYVAELEAGRPVTSDDIASWMHLSPVRSTKTLEQFAAQVREAA